MKTVRFVFNSFQVNTYLIYDHTGECIIIDAGCHSENEIAEIVGFIDSNGLKPRALLNTHGHIDHICGNYYMQEYFKLPLFMHKDDLFLVESAGMYAKLFGFEIHQPPAPADFLKEGETFEFGESSLEVIHVPGHSPGSLIFYSKTNKLLISGDLLFRGSIGRTDLPGGNYDQIIRSIKSKLLTLPEETIVYPGHMESTTIKREIKYNPFLQESI